MNAKEAVELINNNGGDVSKISSAQLFEVLRALHGNFEFSADYKKVFDFIDTNPDAIKDVWDQNEKMFHGVKSDKLGFIHFQSPSDVLSSDVSSLTELDFKRDVTKLFGGDAELKVLDDKIADLFKSYSQSGFQPSLSDIQEIIPLANKLGRESFSGNEKAKFLSEISSLRDTYLLAEGSDKWDLLSEDDIRRNISDLEKIYVELDEDEKEISFLADIQIENSIGNKFTRVSDKAEDLVSNSNEWLPSEKYRKELEAFINDEATRKLALDPEFSQKSEGEQKALFINKRNEVAKNYVSELVLNQEANNFAKKFANAPTKADFDGFSDRAKEILKTLESGDVPKGFKFDKEIALATLGQKISDSAAISQEVFKRTGVKVFYDTAKARKEKFAKDHPAIYKAGKSLAIAGAIGLVSLGNATLGSALSTVYAVHKTHVAYNELKSKYVSDPLYKNKTFAEYRKDHKLETASVYITGAMAVFPAIGVAGKLGLIEPDKLATGVARGATVLALGMTNATNMFLKAKTKKEKALAATLAGVSVAGAFVSVFTSTETGQQFMGKVSEKLGSIFGGSKAVEEVSQGNVGAKTGGAVHTDSIHPVKSDTIPSVKTDSIPVAKADSISGVKTDSIPVAKADSAHVIPEQKGGNSQVVDQTVSTRSDVGQGNISDKDWSRIKIRSVQTYGAEKVKEWSFNINSGQVEAIPEGMSKEEFIYKLGQLQKLAPVVHKESINLMLRDLNCDGTVLTSEQVAQVHESLKMIDIKGEYHGFEPTERTCNRVTGIKVDVNCDDKSVNVKQTVEYGDCNKQPTQASNIRQETPVAQNAVVETPVQRSVVAKQAPTSSAPQVKSTPVVEASTQVVETQAGKEISIKGTVTNTQGVMGDGKGTTALDKMAARGVVGEEYYGEEAPVVLNETRLEYDGIVKDMLAKDEVVRLQFPDGYKQTSEYNELVSKALDKQELVVAPTDKATGNIAYGLAPENEGTVELVKKDTPLYNYMIEQQTKAKIVTNAAIKAKAFSY